MRISVLFAGAERISDIVLLGRRAEASGFAGVYMVEAYRSAWVALTALAAATDRVQLGPYVSNAYGRSPFLTGLTALDFNEFCGGRLVLGVGGGNRDINEAWQGIPHARVLTKMGEYVDLLRAMASTAPGTAVDFEGKVHRMHWSPQRPPTPFPVLLAAIYPAMLKVAAQHADGIAGGALMAARHLQSTLRPTAAVHARAVGRSPEHLRWSAVAFTAVAAERDRARLAMRRAVCGLFAPLPHPYYEFALREQGYGTTVDTVACHLREGKLDAACAAIPDALLDELTIAGSPAECRARLAAYRGTVDELLLLNTLPPSLDAPLAHYDEFLTLASAA
jgi:alkanesulfonate monooxygenase SsuD/methylene tetrahydromethanopterin reductase-like flavin-dependent oxidoreductase (luciferase family)